jgi:hypothetical protein
VRVLPDVVGSRSRLLLAAGTAAVAVTALAGCSQFTSALGQRQAVVSFTSKATLAQRMQVSTACASVPNVTPQPVPSTVKTAYQLPQVVYVITKASDADVARLETCLDKFPAVAGVILQDAGDQGS